MDPPPMSESLLFNIKYNDITRGDNQRKLYLAVVMRQRVGQGGGHVVDLLLLVVVMVVVMVLLDVMRGRRRGRVQQGGRVARRRRGRRHGNIGTVSVQRLGAGFVQGRGVVGAVSAVLGRTSSRHSVGNKLIRFVIISHFKLNYILRLLLSQTKQEQHTQTRKKRGWKRTDQVSYTLDSAGWQLALSLWKPFQEYWETRGDIEGLFV